MDQLIAYGRNIDLLCYAMRFVDGLREDIRTSVHMHRPRILLALALLEEEIIGSG